MNLQWILEDYILNFHNRLCVLETNYKAIPLLIIAFHKNDLYHLLGLHKVLNKGHAKSVIYRIESGELDFKTIRKSPNFNDIKPRLENYSFLHHLFIDNRVKICILGKDLPHNTMNLDVVFYKPGGDRCIVLGLRERKGIYYLTTLHEAHSKKYIHLKQTKIKSIEWKD